MRQFKLWILACVLGFAALLSPQTAQAATNKFCVSVLYHYFDSNQGEDRLQEVTGGGVPLYGTAALERHWMALWRWSGSQWVLHWNNWTDSSGCSPSFDFPTGTLIMPYLQSAVKLGPGWADVRPEMGDAAYWKVWSSVQTLSQGSTWNFSAFEQPFNVSLALGQAEEVGATTMGLTTNTIYNVYSNEPCGDSISCFTGGEILLGDDPNTGPDSESKTVIGHEFGHYVQDKLFGSPNANRSAATGTGSRYGATTAALGCKCDQVSGGTSHCLQSKEYFESAIGEGWGHFYASRMYNNSAQADAFYGYYKDAYPDGATSVTSTAQALDAPVSIPLLNNVKWMGNFCNQSNRGSERDWLGFLYSVNATGANTSDILELAAIFQSACGGGMCTLSDALTWAQVNTAAQSLSTAQEFTKFVDTAVAYGVNK